MSPRSSSTSPATSRSTSAPYPAPRRPSGQPKSSRQQFSACGACRMRRVRCDLKDLAAVNGSPPACSNCKERGLKCVDEFADVKAVKLLRRGRRLQQVEAIYGKVDNSAGPALGASAQRQVTIPSLQPEFFSSQFWKLFHMQRPVLDFSELAARVSAHAKGSNTMNASGEILTLVLVVWAASFGIDERGAPERSSVDEDTNRARTRSSSTSAAQTHKPCDASTKRQGRKERTIAMLHELLELVDVHGLLRKPSWDGCRALLLITPLLEDFLPLERNNFTEIALSQARALCCSHAASSPQSPDHTMTRLRVLSYAVIQDAFINGLSGNKLIFEEIDMDTISRLSVATGLSHSPSFPSSPMGMYPHSNPQSPSSSQSFGGPGYLFMMPLHLAAVCRKINATLTSLPAMRSIEEGHGIDGPSMRAIWEGLDRCWDDFDSIRLSGAASEESVFDLQRFVGAWQAAIFECHNIVRESLKQVLNTGASTPHKSVAYQLQDLATSRCIELLPKTLAIIKMHASHSGNHMDSSGLFRWDTGIVRDGCFFAGILAASIKKDDDYKHEACHISANDLSEGVALTISALSEMKWALSKSEEREQTIRMIWQTKSSMQYPTSNDVQMQYRVEPPFPLPVFSSDAESSRPGSQGLLSIPGHVHGRPQPPPLTLPDGPIRGIASAPTTAVSADGSVWSSYSPPGTATSGTNSTSTTGVSGGGSPMFASPVSAMPVFKSDMDDPAAFFQGSTSDLDAFGAMAVDNNASGVVAAASFDHRGSGYMDSGVSVFTPGPMGPSPGPPDVNSFQDDHGFYHH
ncbi:hypothetical protein HDZ31DRAFT_34884 [Schizophyllum fasciatum]